jgi:WD40 repeat protein/serine/threonine protein kinase
MTEPARCPSCGSPLDPQRPGGHCPRCLLQIGLSAAGGTAEGGDAAGTKGGRAAAVRTPGVIGPYHLLQVLGEGGMGLVYLAEQREPIVRRVALKLIKPGMDTREVLARFEAERHALALMDHPGIARVLDAGLGPEQRPYFVMEYVAGVPITDYCDRHRLPNAARLAIFLQVCAAVQHAHQKGIIHRDIKPQNILVTVQDGKPVPKVIDFGIAKATRQGDVAHAAFTRLGAVIGTPEYISPEQAEADGLEVDTTTDIYSLGVVLYELLTGVLPFDGEMLRQAGYAEMRRIIREQDPPKPSARVTALGATAADVARQHQTTPPALGKQLQGDLDAIAMKALEKDRTRRYPSASEFAADITRYVNGEPVAASPPSAVYRTQKFVRRHRLGVAAAVFAIAALVVGLAVATAFYMRADKARADADRARGAAEYQSYLANLLAADGSLQTGNAADARQRLDTVPPGLRDWAWRFLAGRIDASTTSVVVSGDVAEIADTGPLTTVRLQRGEESFAAMPIGVSDNRERDTKGPPTCLETIELMARQVTGPSSIGSGFEVGLSVDGRFAAVSPWSATGLSFTRERMYSARAEDLENGGDPTIVRIVETSSGRVVRDLRVAGAGAVLVTDSTVTGFGVEPTDHLAGLMDFTRGRFVRAMSGVYPQVMAVAFDPGALRLATWSWSNRIDVWDIGTGARLAAFTGHGDRINAVAFIPNSPRLVSASRDGTVCVWDVDTRKRVGVIATQDPAHAIAVSPMGEFLAIATGDRALGVWSVATRLPVWARSHDARVDALAFSPDGRMLVSGSRDRSVGVWNATNGLPIARLRGHAERVQVVAVRQSGEIVTGGSDRTVRLWTPGDAPVWICGQHGSAVGIVGFAADSRTIYSSAYDGAIGTWRAGTLGAIRASEGVRDRAGDGFTVPALRDSTGDSIVPIDLSPDGQLLASGGDDRVVRLWSVADGKLVHALPGHSAKIGAVAFNPRRNVLVSASADKTVRAWDTSSGALLAALKSDDVDVSWLGFTADGRTLMSASSTGSVRVWHGERFAVESSWNLPRRNLPDIEVTRFALSPDGERVAAGGSDGLVRLAERESGRIVATLKGAAGAIYALAYSPDGTRLLAGSMDGSLRIYDTRTFDRVYTLSGTTVPELRDARLTQPGPRRFLDEFFDVPHLPNFPTSAAFSPDGERIVTGWFDGTVRVLTARRAPVVGGTQ